MFRGRRSLWWLLGPPVLYLGALPLANRVQPVLFGVPFFMCWMLIATLLTPVLIWLAAKGDPVWRADRAAERRDRAAARDARSSRP